jgi:lactoylglutathione lyase
MNLKLNHIQHIGIPVTDIKISEIFYKKLGFKNVMASTFEYNGGKGLVAMMKLKKMIIELYQLPEKEFKKRRYRVNGAINHIAFDVDDIDKTFNEVKKAAFNIIEDKPTFLSFWKKGCKYFIITGPDGERLEFNQIL